MSYVIRLERDEGLVDKGSEHRGRYVSRYDPDAYDGLGRVWSVATPEFALQFDSFQAAALFWRQSSKVKPLREDGKPNRPLTAFTVSIFDWEKK